MPVVVVTLLLAVATSASGEGVPVEPGSASADKFRSASLCMCHEALGGQWRQSMHAQALIDPVFQTKVAQAEREAGPETAALCKRCHSPIGNILNDPDGNTVIEATEGVTCLFCHQVVGDTGAHYNTSQLVLADLTRRAQIEHPDAPHPAKYEAYLRSSEFCGDCHNVNHPDNGLPLSTTYSEWAASPYAKRGTTCQDCHMSGTPGIPGPSSGRAAPFGPVRQDHFSMGFVGANVAQGPAQDSIDMLKSAADIKIDAPAIMTPGTQTSVRITVTNKRAGHSLPTGLTEERQMWLSVFAENQDGTRTKLGEQHFGTVFADAAGKHPVDVWNAASVYSDRRIRASEGTSSAYDFKMPVGAQQAKVLATLDYRSLSDDLAAKSGVPNPTTEMASASKTVYASAALNVALEIVPAPPQPPAPNLWTPLLLAFAFAATIGVASLGILAVQKA